MTKICQASLTVPLTMALPATTGSWIWVVAPLEPSTSTRPLWTIEVMASAMGARREGPLPASVRGISIDSRSIGPSEAFFAIKGDNRDGHDFVNDALEGGAALAVVAAERRGQFFPR